MYCMNDMTKNNALPNPKVGDTVVAADNHVSSGKYFHPYSIVRICVSGRTYRQRWHSEIHTFLWSNNLDLMLIFSSNT